MPLAASFDEWTAICARANNQRRRDECRRGRRDGRAEIQPVIETLRNDQIRLTLSSLAMSISSQQISQYPTTTRSNCGGISSKVVSNKWEGRPEGQLKFPHLIDQTVKWFWYVSSTLKNGEIFFFPSSLSSSELLKLIKVVFQCVWI